ncbi:MAG: kelch repeat-containing protein [Myxococcota bacterium]
MRVSLRMGRLLGALISLVCLVSSCGSESATTEARPDSWQLRASMATPRSEIAAAALDNQIYVAGGIVSIEITDRAEVYDEATDAWSSLPSLPRPLHHVAMTACGGDVYASGGYTNLGFARDEDPTLWRLTTDAWVAVTNLPEPIGEHAMACIDGLVHLVGGNTDAGPTGAMRRFEGDAWFDLPPMPTPRHSTAIALLDGWLYVTGGRNDTTSELDVVEAFDVATGRWETRASLPVGRGGHAAAARDGRLHAFGGELLDESVVLDLHEIYDPTSDSWTDGVPLPEPRHGLAAAVLDERIYAIGGGSEAGMRTVMSTTGTLQVLGPFEPEGAEP